MKNILSTIAVIFLIISGIINAQNITNTLGAGGLFKVKDATTDFLILKQSNGTITLPLQLAGNQRGSIFKGSDRFLHTYYGTGTTGNNTFLGIDAGNFTMGGALTNYGSYNTGVGYQSLSSITNGQFNSAFGYSSLYLNTTGFANAAFGSSSLYSNTTGYYNSAFGESSLSQNGTGIGNSAFGFESLNSNISGNSNTAIGIAALHSNIAGNKATAIGYGVMENANNTTTTFNNYNVAVGYQALRGSFTPSNNTGNYNTVIGSLSLLNNSSGNSNTANGYSTLYSNTTGYENTAAGFRSLFSNETGHENSAFGYNSLYTNVSGRQNTAIGHHSLEINTGNYNTALGFNAGSTVTSGYNLTLIGIDANPSSPTAFDEITLGNQYVDYLRCAVTTITSLSDRRDKKNIKDLDLGIDFLMKIKPRQFNWDKREWYDGNVSDGSKMKEAPTAGFIAQELDEVQTNENAEWLNLVLKDNPEKWEATPGNLLPIMVKAIQELAIKNDQLASAVDGLKIEKDEEVAKLKEEISFLKSEVQRVSSIEEELTKIEFLKEELIQQLNELKSVQKEYENKFSSIENQR